MTETEKTQLIAALTRKLQYITRETQTPNFNQTLESIAKSYNNNNIRKKQQLEELLNHIDRILKEQ